jgi:tRNA-uridine 2-sulfurtransferase
MVKNKPKIVVAMSGGVDSSVAAALLKQAGFDVIGIFMKFWKDPSAGSGQADENRCCSVESEKLARLVAKKLGIPFYVLNVEKEFKRKVVDYFLKDYKKGNTPNPCVVCNKEIKFGFLIKKALSLGADFIVTGHYARIENGKLFKGKDKAKDQSYFLWQLDQKQLDRVLFPVGGYTKPEVRKLAKKFKLPTAETPESQEVCFIKDTTSDFLKKYLKTKPGNIIDIEGKKLGKHNGLWFYTIGQRRGLEIPQGSASAQKGSGETKPYYVVAKDSKKNILIISKNQKDLAKKELVASDVNWTVLQKLPMNAEVKIRYKSDFAKAKISAIGKNKVKIVFIKSQRAITPGQSVVFYRREELLGGGIIK